MLDFQSCCYRWHYAYCSFVFAAACITWFSFIAYLRINLFCTVGLYFSHSFATRENSAFYDHLWTQFLNQHATNIYLVEGELKTLKQLYTYEHCYSCLYRSYYKYWTVVFMCLSKRSWKKYAFVLLFLQTSVCYSDTLPL